MYDICTNLVGCVIYLCLVFAIVLPLLKKVYVPYIGDKPALVKVGNIVHVRVT